MSDIKYQISTIKSQLASAYPADEADALAWWIAEEVTGLSRTELQFGCKDTKNFAHTQEIIKRLLRFEPIQYIFGHTLWYGLDLKVTPATLIPRPETAGLVEQISNLKSQISNAPIRVLDIGTGSGCIGIALKKAHPDWHVTGIDISPEAIAVARENALRNHADVNFRIADIFSDEIDKTFNSQLSTFNLIVSNPPYICESEKKDMRPNVLDYEPSTALFVPDSDPLLYYRRIASLFSNRPPVTLFFEINESYAAEVAAMMADLGYTGIRITKDIYGKDRIIEGRMAQ
ncbi:MAG: peptide chain release factor N(5)-glutamine methyltransferase [Paludibacteraceae bacterium]|nr:peptide chain release factor N(5)-glutamine methyltransferase [Paludibacteraceae bacterium]